MLDKLGKKLAEVGQGALNSTQRMADMTTLGNKIEEEQRTLRSFYHQLGQQAYLLLGQNPPEELAALCGNIAESLRAIEEYQEQLKQTKGVTRCGGCGGEMSAAAVFCPACGLPTGVQPPAVPQCPACGFATQGASFCPQCGTKVAAQPNAAPAN